MENVQIKMLPEDFLVEERITLPLLSSGPFRVYRLWKRNCNTADAVSRIAGECAISREKIRYGGKKDRRGETVQYLSVPSSCVLSFSHEDASCEFAGYASEPMGPQWIGCNSFSLTLRGFSSPARREELIFRLHLAARYGVPNYYDDQRFGAGGADRPFFAEALLANNPQEALRLFFTEVHPQAPSGVRRKARMVSRYWGKWRKLYPFVSPGLQRKILGILRREEFPSGAWKGVNALPREKLGMYCSSFQAFLWNQLLRDVLEEHFSPEGYILCGGSEMPLFFSAFQNAGGDARMEALEKTELLSFSLQQPPEGVWWGAAWQKVLRERNVKAEDFALPLLRGAWFGSFGRPALTAPRNLAVQIPSEEKRFSGSLGLSFDLPRGSYATLVVKAALFSKR